MNRFKDMEPRPWAMPEAGLQCAIAACEASPHHSDRMFAYECSVELQRRRDGLPPIPNELARELRMESESA